MKWWGVTATMNHKQAKKNCLKKLTKGKKKPGKWDAKVSAQ